MDAKSPTPELPHRYNDTEAAAYLNISLRQLRRLRENRLISFARIGGLHPSYTREQLDAYVASVTVEAVIPDGY